MTSSSALLLAPEAERIIESLHCFEDLKDVGSGKWIHQHILLQKLNLQAHYSVAQKSDNFVLEYLLSHDKLGVLLNDLLMIEAFREKIFPRIVEKCAKDFPIRTYHVMYHEATVANLLEVLVFHDYVVEALESSLVVDLIDYCCSNVAWLCQQSLSDNNDACGDPLEGEDANGLEKQGEEVTHMLNQAREMRWKSALASVTILRYLCEHVTKLPLSALTRLIDTHDVPCLVVPLIENPPWTRRSGSKWEKFYEQAWHVVPPEDLLKLTSMEAQPWLMLFNLLCEGQVRQSYSVHSFRKDTILRVRKYINALLLDQLPVLAQLQRFLDELVIIDAPHVTQGVNKSLIMQQVASVRDALMSDRRDWQKVADSVLKGVFSGKETQEDKIVQELAGLYSENTMEHVFDSAPNPAAEEPRARPEENDNHAVLIEALGRRLRLEPTTKEGTLQPTAKGLFERFELEPLEGPTKLETLVLPFAEELSLSCLRPKERPLLSLTQQGKSLTKDEFKCLSPAEAHRLKKEGKWIHAGSVEEGAIVQLLCVLEEVDVSFKIQRAFLSIEKAQKSL